MTSLNQLHVGTRGRVRDVRGDPALVQRLGELGIFEGEFVEVLGVAPLGDPLEIRAGDTRLSLRRDEAAGIDVDLLVSPSIEP
jgi:ferrous iron transport protein A